MGFNPFSLSGDTGDILGSVFEESLETLVGNNASLKALADFLFIVAKQPNTGANNAVIADYRKASIHLPKYYKEYDEGKVATIETVNAVPGETQPDIGFGSRSIDTFILKDVEEAYRERYQIVETFGDDFGVFFTGQEPKVFVFRGVLINDAYRNWRSFFLSSYGSFLRGSELAKRRIKVSVTYDYINIEGYIFDLSVRTDAENEVDVPFQFSVLVTDMVDSGPDLFTEPVYEGEMGEPLYQAHSAVIVAILEKIPGLKDSPYLQEIKKVIDVILNSNLDPSILEVIEDIILIGTDVYEGVSSGELFSVFDTEGLITEGITSASEYTVSLLSSVTATSVPSLDDLLNTVYSSSVYGTLEQIAEDVMYVYDQYK